MSVLKGVDCISICEIHIIYCKKKKRNLWSSFFQNFGLSGYVEKEIYEFLFQTWPKDGPRYYNANKMFDIKFMLQRRNFSSYGQRNVKFCVI